jgi:hypothetical protein
MKRILLSLATLAVVGCSLFDSSNQKKQFSGPFADFFKEETRLTQDKYNLDDCNRAYSLAFGLNDETAKDKALKDFETAHKAIIEEISSKYPGGTLNLPIVQNDPSIVSVGRLYISNYMFPWNTATRLSYQLSFDCVVNQKKDLSMVRFEFYDSDGDLFMTSSVSVIQSGTYNFEIRPEVEFFHFEKAIVTVN